MQITQEQIEQLVWDATTAELNSRFDWNTDVAGNSYNADGVSAAYQDVMSTLGLPDLVITEEMVRQHLEDVSEDPDDYNLSDYID